MAQETTGLAKAILEKGVLKKKEKEGPDPMSLAAKELYRAAKGDDEEGFSRALSAWYDIAKTKEGG